MERRPDQTPAETADHTPSIAGMYDVYAGGGHGHDPDREAADAALRALPGLDIAVRANRAFLRRAVRHTARLGIGQFLDIGSGYLAEGPGNIHDVARDIVPDARVAYVELDAGAVDHNRALLDGDPHAVAVQGDFLKTGDILTDPRIRALIDLDEPVAVSLAAILHFIEDKDDPWGKVAELRDALAPGSALILSHAYVTPERTGTGPDAIKDVYRAFGSQLQNRGPDETGRFFDGFTLVEPGLTNMADWRPDPDTETGHPMSHSGVVGVGIKD
ncbi:SAM-dependent methyltransferase [Streptomyces sp. NPDC052644]|uniref:SAM-dependent methyltransferase n=1 Tax=unclassified Streptomyces TaxID=2593676 RepID=UPI00331D9755